MNADKLDSKKDTQKKVRAGVVGATGYAGAELVRLLSGHPGADLTILTSRNHVGKRFEEIYPSMTGVIDLTCESFDIQKISELTDVVFTALPHKLPMELVPKLIENGKKVVDLSADFRFRDVSKYEEYYQHHTAKNTLSKAVYGLAEIFKTEIRNSDLVGNPGCYPTSVLLPLVPILKEKLIEPDFLIADSKSGVSGAGRAPSLTTIFCEVSESFKAYKVAEHRHRPEMEEILSWSADQDIKITFTPHLVPMSRGMLTTIYVKPVTHVKPDDIFRCLNKFYLNAPFVRILPENRLPDTLHVRGTNFCDVGVKMDPHTGHLILLSAIDNLVKGAAGQAVQNMNIMMGYAETDGLTHAPFPL